MFLMSQKVLKMKNTNKESTRYFSDKHEKSICKVLHAVQQPNSGAGNWRKGDVVQKAASMLIEAKCSMSEKQSFSVKKDWIIKNREEKFAQRLYNSCICFNFEPDGENFYIIDEKLMKFLINELIDDIANA